MVTTIYETQTAIRNSFLKTVKDYRDKKIEIEEDCRACFYHHMRPFIDQHKDLAILLSHKLRFVGKIMRPDITIFRKNLYFMVIEIKCDTIHRKYNPRRGSLDARRLRGIKYNIERTFLIHIDQQARKIKRINKDWKNNFFVELYHIVDVNKTGIYEIIDGKKNHIIIGF